MLSHIKYIRAVLCLSVLQLFCLLHTHTAFAQTTYDKPYGLVELSNVPTPAQEVTLNEAGITLLDYFYDLTWAASFSAPIDPTQIELVVSVREVQPSEKISPLFETLGASLSLDPEDNQIEVFIESWDTMQTDHLTQYGTIVSSDPTCMIVQIHRDDTQPLANHPNIRWIEPVLPAVSLENGSSFVKGMTLNTDRQRNNNLNVFTTVGIYDLDGPIEPLPDFADRLDNETFDAGDSNTYYEHATKVAFILHKTDPLTYMNSYSSQSCKAMENVEIDIATHVWGDVNCIRVGNYTFESKNFDLYNLPLIISVGNSGDRCSEVYGTVLGGIQSAKNVITIGALNEFKTAISDDSSRGPTGDGRIAPTFILQGEKVPTKCLGNLDCEGNGTSYAAPQFAGLATQLLTVYRASLDDKTATLSSADLRALFAATATDFGRPGPDYEYGFGVPHITNTISALPYLRWFEMRNRDEQLNTVVPVDDTAESFTVVLAWDDHMSHAYRIDSVTQTVLVNDLNLTVTSPDGTKYYPFTLNPDVPTETAKTGVDNVNTIEQIVVDNPQVGDWTVSVGRNGPIIGSAQRYTLVPMTVPSSASSIPLSITLSAPSTANGAGGILLPILLLVILTSVFLIRKQSHPLKQGLISPQSRD